MQLIKLKRKKSEKKANTETKTKQMLSMSDKKFVYSYVARIQLCKAKKSNLSTCHNIFGCKNNLTLHGRIQEYWLNLWNSVLIYKYIYIYIYIYICIYIYMYIYLVICLSLKFLPHIWKNDQNDPCQLGVDVDDLPLQTSSTSKTSHIF